MIDRLLPCVGWLKRYNGETFHGDALAAVIVTIMLIPQSLAYALLAGLPPEVGLYASMLPLVGYALFGSSNALAVGPVAVVSLMTAAAIGKVTAAGGVDYAAAALALAAMSGAILIALGLLRLGFLASLLSHPVISGFITASGLLIAASQLKHILGIEAVMNPETHALRFGRLARRRDRRDQSADAGDRRAGDGVPVLGARAPQAAAAPVRPRPAARRRGRQGGAGRRRHRHHRGGRAARARPPRWWR